MNYIRWFTEIGIPELGLVGGKGANLGELTKAGLPVPPGFCVTSEAYREFLKTTQPDQPIEEILKAIDLADMTDIESKTAQIGTLLQTQTIPTAISDEISTSYRRLMEERGHEIPLAVRSSATEEDQANASFAGQLETYLNVRGLPSLMEHIQKCWASLWTSRVVSYVANQGLDLRAVSMSVVVQCMIPSEVSGVLFTANPITGMQDQVVINASWGLGEAIVSGIVSPDTITARKIDGKVIDRITQVKETKVAYAAGGGTEQLPVPEEMREAPILTNRQVQELVALGCRIEAHYGKPQDIEWGYYRGKWYLLQSRPITTLALQPERQFPAGEFNRTMFIEIFPDPLSPIFLSIIEPLFKDMLDFTFRALGFHPPKNMSAIGVFYNQPYFNRGYIAAAFEKLSPAVREPLIAQVVNPFGTHEESASAELSWPFVRMAFRILRFMVRFPGQLPGLLVNYQEEVTRVQAFQYQTASEAEICAWVRRLPYDYASKLLNNDFLMIAVIGRTYRLLGAILHRTYGTDTQEVVAKLVSGVTGNVTMETNKRLWDLAVIARSSPSASAILRENDWRQARRLLKLEPDGLAFLQAMDQFLGQYGHREVHMDILYPTWSEDPGPVYSFIRSYLDADEAQSPYRQQERLTQEREQLTEKVIQDLEKSLVGRLLVTRLFKWILKQTQTHTRERDTMHFEMTRIFPPIRDMLHDLGGRWVIKGLLEKEEDILFLELDEIESVVQNPVRMQETVRARRKAFAENQQLPWPNIIRNGEEIFVPKSEVSESEATCLQGVAGSPGKAEGTARVILGPEQFASLKKGEILVAPITNPVWTPLFAIAGGVITEVGGILSHGAIVAREYGIPAVMSVPGATRLFQDGQRLLVDGNKGVVYLGRKT